MNMIKRNIPIIIIVILLSNFFVQAHPGMSDVNGGHFDSKDGSYHYHHGYPEHTHANNTCPYNFELAPKETKTVTSPTFSQEEQSAFAEYEIAYNLGHAQGKTFNYNNTFEEGSEQYYAYDDGYLDVSLLHENRLEKIDETLILHLNQLAEEQYNEISNKIYLDAYDEGYNDHTSQIGDEADGWLTTILMLYAVTLMASWYYAKSHERLYNCIEKDYHVAINSINSNTVYSHITDSNVNLDQYFTYVHKSHKETCIALVLLVIALLCVNGFQFYLRMSVQNAEITELTEKLNARDLAIKEKNTEISNLKVQINTNEKSLRVNTFMANDNGLTLTEYLDNVIEYENIP